MNEAEATVSGAQEEREEEAVAGEAEVGACSPRMETLSQRMNNTEGQTKDSRKVEEQGVNSEETEAATGVIALSGRTPTTASQTTRELWPGRTTRRSWKSNSTNTKCRS